MSKLYSYVLYPVVGVPRQSQKTVTFFTFTHLSIAGGTERSLIQYINNAPGDWNLRIIHSGNENAPHWINSKAGRSIKVFQFPQYIKKFDFVVRAPGGNAILNFIIEPIIFRVQRALIRKNREIKAALKESSIVYVFENAYGYMLSGRNYVVIGSTHNWDPDMRRGHNILTLLVQKRLFWRRIDYFHVFPHLSWLLSGYAKGFTLPGGVDLDSLAPLADTKPSGRFVFYARLVECKGVNRVIKAFELLRSRDPELTTELTIAGIGEFTLPEGADSHIKFKGKLSDEDLVKTLRNSDCFVFPSTCDTYGLSILEALATGLHCIVSDNFRGIFDDFAEIGALEYCSVDEETLSTRMEQFVREPQRTERVETDTRKLLEQKYSWKVVVPELFKNFERILAENR